MNYIPDSHIKQERNREIKKLPLLEDVINKIIKLNDEFINIDNCIDRFWINLAKETCNLYRWSRYSFHILLNHFGETKFKFLDNTDKLFIDLKAELDTLVCNYYHRNIHSIEDIYLTDLFYNNYNIIKYPIRYNDRRKKYITRAEQIYIMTFIERIKVYCKYIENNIDKFSIN